MSTANSAIQQQVHALYSHHHGWLQGWLRRKLGDAHHAADLAQDTFVRVLTATHGRAANETGQEENSATAPLRLDTLREPRAYLTAVAHGLMVNHLRRRDLERAYLEALAHQSEPVVPSPETRALVIETLMEIDAMLDGLSAKARQAFLLSQLEGLTYADIAQRLGVSVSMVRKYMLQAVTHCLRIRGD